MSFALAAMLLVHARTIRESASDSPCFGCFGKSVTDAASKTHLSKFEPSVEALGTQLQDDERILARGEGLIEKEAREVYTASGSLVQQGTDLVIKKDFHPACVKGEVMSSSKTKCSDINERGCPANLSVWCRKATKTSCCCGAENFDRKMVVYLPPTKRHRVATDQCRVEYDAEIVTKMQKGDTLTVSAGFRSLGSASGPRQIEQGDIGIFQEYREDGNALVRFYQIRTSAQKQWVSKSDITKLRRLGEKDTHSDKYWEEKEKKMPYYMLQEILDEYPDASVEEIKSKLAARIEEEGGDRPW